MLHADTINAPPADVPLADVLARYYDEHGANLPSAEAIRHHVRRWVEHWGNATVDALTPRAQDEFRAALAAEGLSPGYVRRLLATGRAALNRAHRRQEVRTVPFVELPAKAAPQRQARRLEAAETARLLEAAAGRGDHLLLFCLVGLATLARPEAIVELTAEQCRFDDELVALNPEGRAQTKKHRPVVPMCRTIRPWLRRACEASVTGRLIEYRGQPVKSLKKAFGKAVGDAGLTGNVTPYSLRHTMGRELRRRGVKEWDAAGVMGHRTAGTTETYAEYDPGYLSDVAGAIDAYLEAVQSELAVRGEPLCITLAGQRANNVRAIGH